VHAAPAWMVVLIVGREFAVSGLRGIAAVEGYTIKASELGKTKMIAQVVAISFLLLSIRHPNLSALAHWMMWGVVVFTVASAVDYFRKFWRKVDERVKKRRRRELLRMERRQRLRATAAVGQSGSGVGGFRGTI
jgi:CDP-diacylglycerol--glycerol-3-phosphate 3-phosphatidyltransferase